MKNLKRALSFAVAAVMLVGMMAIGTSAFTDDAAIENSTAVNVMYNLGIINGKPDGSFDPTATVTRGEMAKMICVALNGGKDPILDTATSSYPDTVGHWAAGYIEYCTTMGIVAGSTDGNFYPNNPITGVEAAKMVLIALGYNAEYEGFVNNAKWSNNISIVANNNGLWEDVTSLPGAAISRDNAAQLLYNGLTVECVTYTYELGTVNGDLTSIPVVINDSLKETILIDKFAMETGTAVLTDVAWNTTTEKYDYTFADADNVGIASGTVDYSELFGMEVTVLWKPGTTNKLYGMYANGAVVATGNYGDLVNEYVAAEEGVLFGDDYIAAAAALDELFYLDPSNTAGASAEGAFAVAILDKDGDEKADTVVIYPFEVTTVGFVGKTQVKVGNDYYKFEDHNVYTGIAAEDWAQVAPAANTVDGKATITKMTAVTGTPAALKSGEYKIGNEWYTLVEGAISGNALTLNTEYEMIVVGTYIYNAEAVEDEVVLADLVYIMDKDTAGTSMATKGTQKVKVMYTDGTSAVVTVVKVGDTKVADGAAIENGDIGTLFTYEVNKDGNYELTAFDGADYIYTAGVESADEGKFATAADGTYRLAADAILFVVDGEGEVSVVKAADAAKWACAVTGELWGEEANGFAYAQLGVLYTEGTAADSDAVYGVVVDEYYKVKVDSTEYFKVSVWNGTENVELTVATADEANIGLGQLVTWTVDEDGVADVAKFGTEGAVKAYDGTSIIVDSDELTFAEDAVILYVDSEEVAGVEGGKISIADKLENGNYVNNVYYIVDDTDNDGADEITVLVVEVNNEWTGAILGE